MFVESMTFEEIRKEFNKDKKVLMKHIVFHGKKIYKFMRHTNMHHYDKYHDYMSPQKNHWVIRMKADSQKTGDGLITQYCYYFTRRSYSVLSYSAVTDKLFFYRGHFFTRFYQREELEKDFMHDLIKKYLDINHISVTQPLADLGNGIIRVFGQLTTGVALGYHHQEINLTEFRTFISNDMLKGDQVTLSKMLEEKFKLHVVRKAPEES